MSKITQLNQTHTITKTSLIFGHNNDTQQEIATLISKQSTYTTTTTCHNNNKNTILDSHYTT